MRYFSRSIYSSSTACLHGLCKPATFGLLLLGLFSSLQANAQPAPVVDAAGTQPVPARTLLAQNANSGNEMVMSLYMQLEQLQREVQNLRGQVEEQAYQIRRMETEQRDRYLDLDRRLSGGAGADAGFEGGAGTEPFDAGGVGAPDQEGEITSPGGEGIAGGAGRGAGADGSPTGAGTAPISPAPANANADDQGSQAATTLPASPENEQQIYRQALSFLLEENRYENAIEQFQFYIDNYPEGRYLTNAYYWKGEALLLVERYEEAQTAFQTVVNDYPLDPKAAGSLLKLGVAYRELGQEAQAREAWERLRSEYPSSLTEISVADDYLSRLGQQ